MKVSAGPATALARPVLLSGAWNASDSDLADRFEPLYRRALERLPDGDQVFRGIPFHLGSRQLGRRWLLVDRERAIDLRGLGPASHLVIAHFSDSWRHPDGTRPAGMPVGWVNVKVAVLSGALAGLAGAIEVAGRTGYVTLDMSPGYGYSGIVIAMLAGLNPLGVIAASVFVAGILVGADSMSRAINVPTYIADVIVAASLISVLVATMLTQYKIRRL